MTLVQLPILKRKKKDMQTVGMVILVLAKHQNKKKQDSSGLHINKKKKKKDELSSIRNKLSSIGKTPEQKKEKKKKRIDAFSKEKRHGGWKIDDLDSKKFTYKGQNGVELYFSTSSGFKGFSAMTKALARILNKDKEYVEGLVERFEQIKKKRGF